MRGTRGLSRDGKGGILDQQPKEGSLAFAQEGRGEIPGEASPPQLEGSFADPEFHRREAASPRAKLGEGPGFAYIVRAAPLEGLFHILYRAIGYIDDALSGFGPLMAAQGEEVFRRQYQDIRGRVIESGRAV